MQRSSNPHLFSSRSGVIRMLGSPRRCCDGITRRETLVAGALTCLGGAFNLPSLFAAESSPAKIRPKAKNVIMLYLLGGAPTQDMYDLKPDAPAEVRTAFKPIDTNVSGIQICEHLPKMARWMHRTALIRSVNHAAGCHNCLPSYTGYEAVMPDQAPRANDPPSMGSVCEYLYPTPSADDVPSYVYLPNVLGWGQSIRRAGPYGGFLGKRYDAFTSECLPDMDPGITAVQGKPATVRGRPLMTHSKLPEDITIDRFHSRKDLLQQINDERARLETAGSVQRYNSLQQRAFGVLGESKLAEAFSLEREPAETVARFGNTLFGNSALVARRSRCSIRSTRR
jgi:hypothetical protein